MRIAIVTLAASAVLLGGPACAWAADEPPSLFAGSIWNAIWALLIFVILLLVLGRFAWKPVVKVLDEREARIRNTIAEAERGRDEATALLERQRKQMAEAHAETQRLVERARADADALREQIVRDAGGEAEKVRERAVRQIEISRNEALKAIFAETATLATRVAGQILQRELRPEDQQRLVDEALSQVQQRESSKQ